MTPEILGTTAAIVWSLIATYVPGLNKKYAEMDPTNQRLIMLGVLAATALGAFGLTCANLFTSVIPATCTSSGAQDLAQTFVLALVANQATWLITPKPAVVQEAKLVRVAATEKTADTARKE